MVVRKCDPQAWHETGEWRLVCGTKCPNPVPRRAIMCLHAKTARIRLHRHDDGVLSGDHGRAVMNENFPLWWRQVHRNLPVDIREFLRRNRGDTRMLGVAGMS